MRPRTYQIEMVDAIVDYIFKKEGNPVVASPTGTGKTVAFNYLLCKLKELAPNMRAMVVTHDQRIIAQNASSMQKIAPKLSVGIYSSGLNMRETHCDITFAGIQSVYKRAADFGSLDVLIIDEAHCVSPKDNTMYQKFVRALYENNPNLRVIGFSGTPYRMGSGMITEGDLFDEVAVDFTRTEKFNWFVNEGYLSRLVTKSTKAAIDVTNVAMKGGDFDEHELQAVTDTDELNLAIANEVITHGKDRHHWLGFATGVKHGERLADVFKKKGVSCEVFHTTLVESVKEERLKAFETGKLRCLINVGMLTTGYDFPALDLIFVARATQSTGLWCLDSKTEVLTQRGFKTKDEILNTDLVASVNANMQAEYVPILAKVKRKMLPGEFFVSLDGPSSDWRVTNKHRMLWRTCYGRKKTRTEPAFVEAAELIGQECVEIPVSGKGHDVDLPLTDAELRFIGLFMTDGTLDKSNQQISIYQSKRYPHILEEIRKCFAECGFRLREGFRKRPPYFDIHRFCVAKGNWAHLKKWISKDFPEELMNLSTRQFKILLEAIHWGDGAKQPKNVDWTQRSYHISTGNKTFAERLQQVCLMNGHRATIKKTHVYLIRIKEQLWNNSSKSNDGRPQIKKTPRTSETVWCVENKNGTLFTRRNGKVIITGNCQILGRGTRALYVPGMPLETAEERVKAIAISPKPNALVLDFAQNTIRLGPINDPLIPLPRRKGAPVVGEAPVKVCPQCGVYNHTRAAHCSECGFEFPPPATLKGTAGVQEVMTALPQQDQVFDFDVDYVIYHCHNTKAGNPAVEITYLCGATRFKKYLVFSSEPALQSRMVNWWKHHSGGKPTPATPQEFVAREKELAVPKTIRVITNRKYPEVIGTMFE